MGAFVENFKGNKVIKIDDGQRNVSFGQAKAVAFCKDIENVVNWLETKTDGDCDVANGRWPWKLKRHEVKLIIGSIDQVIQFAKKGDLT